MSFINLLTNYLQVLQSVIFPTRIRSTFQHILVLITTHPLRRFFSICQDYQRGIARRQLSRAHFTWPISLKTMTFILFPSLFYPSHRGVHDVDFKVDASGIEEVGENSAVLDLL